MRAKTIRDDCNNDSKITIKSPSYTLLLQTTPRRLHDNTVVPVGQVSSNAAILTDSLSLQLNDENSGIVLVEMSAEVLLSHEVFDCWLEFGDLSLRMISLADDDSELGCVFRFRGLQNESSVSFE